MEGQRGKREKLGLYMHAEADITSELMSCSGGTG